MRVNIKMANAAAMPHHAIGRITIYLKQQNMILIRAAQAPFFLQNIGISAQAMA